MLQAPGVSRAASALRWARLRTSDATTAKPLHRSPARGFDGGFDGGFDDGVEGQDAGGWRC